MLSTVAIVTALSTLVAAQTSLPLNFTVTFSRAELDTCGSADQAEGLAFSTAIIPDRFTCFNLDDIFGQNFTSGVRNQTSTTSPLSWVVRNGEMFDPAANYSRILYRQANATVESGRIASRAFNVYNGRQCMQTSPGPEGGVGPWFGWSCQSEGTGDCYNLPYSVKSFAINTRTNVNSGDGCWDFAYNGDATKPSASLALTLFVTLLLVWL